MKTASMTILALLVLLYLNKSPASAFQASCVGRTTVSSAITPRVRPPTALLSTEEPEEAKDVLDSIEFESEEQKKEAVGNLVADDEWNGLSMELTEVIRMAVIEDMKRNAREFLGKDDYKLGDVSKEIDVRVKDEVARMRGKTEYQLGDLVLAMDEMSKNMTEKLTGKEYEPGDLSLELDKRIKASVAEFCGKEKDANAYEFGDLTREISKRVQTRVEEFTGKPYEFGDIARSIEKRRQEWAKDFLGEEAYENYQFGDITKKFVKNFTGKEDYQFGDISKKLFGDLFGPRKKGASSE